MHPDPRELREQRKGLGDRTTDEELRFRHARLLLELSRATGADWGASIRHICEFEAQVLNVERVSYWSYYPEASALVCDAGYVASRRIYEQGATLLEREHPEVFQAIRDARLVVVEDVDTDPRLSRPTREYCAARGITSMLVVPVWMEGRLRGMLAHSQVGVARRWSAVEQGFAIGVGQVVAAAVAARTQSPAEAAGRRAAFLDGISRAVLSSLDVRKIARSAVELAVPKLAEISNIWMRKRDDRLECVASANVAPSQGAWVREAVHATTKREAPVLGGLVVSQRQSLLIPNTGPAMAELSSEIGTDKRAIFESAGISAAMAVPLSVAGETFGAMTFFAVGGRNYDSDDLTLAQEVAGRVAAGLEHARVHGIARDAIKARDEFLVLLAHELRTPLTSTRLMTDDLLRKAQRSGDTDEQTKSEKLGRQVRRLCGLVENVIEAMNVRAEGVTLTLAACDLAPVVESAVGQVVHLAERAGCPIAVSLVSVTGQFDGARIERVLMSLLDNAIKFGAGKPIDILLRRDDDHAELSVRDHGHGIAPDRLPGIFSPFERAVPKEHFGGLGLGLYVAHAVVEAHGGSIAVKSELGQGTTVTVGLPLAPR
jgi:signal transduction histidine kinase